MARKPAVAIQEAVDNNEDFENYLETHKDKLICMEVYSEFCGPCLAAGNAIRKGKMEIGPDRIVMVRKGKLIRAMFGPNGIDLCRIMEEELKKSADEEQGIPVHRARLEIRDMLPEEAQRMEEDIKLEEDYKEAAERLRVLTLAARKKRVNERLSTMIRRLNFIIFWPHCHQAHYDLYEKWDNINITVAAKETVQMDEAAAREALYMSDVDPNEACLHALFDGEALIVLFKMYDTDTRDFVQLMRYTLYEEIPIPKDDVPPEKQLPPIPAYERYASISKSARQIRRDRYNAKLAKLAQEKEEAERLAAEQARLAREAAEEAARVEKQHQEEERMARIAAGLPADLPPPEPEPGVEAEHVEGEHVEGEHGEEGGAEGAPKEEGEEAAAAPEGVDQATGEGGEGGETVPPDEVVPEVKEEVFHSDVEVEGEDFIPAGGLFVPGLFTPANELGKACGLAYFFPKQVNEYAEIIETEYLPPHILVIFPIDKRYDVQEVISNFSSEILNMGIFVGDDPYKAEHIAYTIKQYDKIIRPRRYYDRLALMVSRKRSLPLLQLAGLNPVYISADVTTGEHECLAMFPVGYGDDYFEEESVKDEEVVMEVVDAAKESAVEVTPAESGEQKPEDAVAAADAAP